LERRHESSRGAGHGESVWLGWFLHAALLKFAPIAERRGRSDAAASGASTLSRCKQAIAREAWTVTGTGAVILTTARPWVGGER